MKNNYFTIQRKKNYIPLTILALALLLTFLNTTTLAYSQEGYKLVQYIESGCQISNCPDILPEVGERNYWSDWFNAGLK